MNVWRCLSVCLLLSFFSIRSVAQNLDSLLNLSAFTAESDLQKQLNQLAKVGVGKALTTRETPGILSVISSDEIRKMGARDITDILRTIPGFDIGQDVQFVAGVSFRGNWANEGKVLFLIDGQQVNDLLYQTVPLINNFAVDAIDKIEIIRGPGSAVYGGSAEYAVVNIITKQASSLNGVSAYGIGGFHSSSVGRTNGGVMVAQKSKNVQWDLGFFQGKGKVSDQNNYVDQLQAANVNYPTSDLAKVTSADPMNVNVGLKVNGLSVRGMYNGYKTNDPVNFTKYDNYSADIKYEFKINNKLTLTPQYVYMNQIPWSWGTVSDGAYALQARATRSLANLTANYSLNRKINIVGGAVYFADKGVDLLSDNAYFGGQDFNLYNYAIFAQGLIKGRLANVTVGARYEKNNRAGDAFVPRLALTKKIENFHFKVLYSQAFRSPAIENQHLALTGKVVPEKSNVAELELGYQFTPEMLLAVNAFYLNTTNVITYQYLPDGTEGYQNFSRSGSSGVELVYSLRKRNWNMNLNYSYAHANTNSTVDTYKVPQTNAQFVGMPASKLVGVFNFSITQNISWNLTGIYSGKRYAYTNYDVDGNPISTSLDPYVLANSFVNFETKGFVFGVGAYDIFNQKPVIPQAYNGNYAPIPGRSREYVVKISYQLNFKSR
ncbi:MAG TPA: TonB-dependent receptor plug domain-containing protein [Cyclobacteriaceae bacterium]|jgi:outer membrane cobalamin receptor|nr:TonB-dependent receptor plug domain-containing protein [Cyclobacteriaceae bacterium]